MRANTILGYFEAMSYFRKRHLLLDDGFVGKEVGFKFKGNTYSICFPKFIFDENDRESPFISYVDTKVQLSWARDNTRRSKLGYASSFNPKEKTVNRFSASQYIIRSAHPVDAILARTMKQELILWQQSLPHWIEALEYKDLSQKSLVAEQKEVVESYFIPLSKKYKFRRVKKKNDTSATINIVSGVPLNLNNLKKSLKLNSLGALPPDYYLFTIRALKHFNKQRYREAVLDSATAFEMALTQLLDAKLTKMKKTEKKLVNDKYKQIMGLYEALKTLGVSLPAQNDVQTKIAEPRNSAIHKGTVITEDQAKVALQFVKDFIYLKLPLR